MRLCILVWLMYISTVNAKYVLFERDNIINRTVESGVV